MSLKVLVTGKNRKVASDICEHLQTDRGYVTIKCDPNKRALFDLMLTELPKVVIICLGDESSVTIQAYNVMRRALMQGNITTIVVTDESDEKLFMEYTELERVFFLSRPVSLFALYEKLSEIEKKLEEEKEQNLSSFREFFNENMPGRKQILVVDDDSEQLIHIKEQLEEFYDVTCVRSGEAAFRFLAKKKCDLILLDYLMPMMDGPEVLRNLHDTKDWEDIPVIFLTGVTEKKKVIQTLAELRPQGYLVKPSKKSEIVAKIIDALEEKEREKENGD
ncbi:MAG: response regulator [Lachnospiraceae bacterium]|nr:response regulator [Lachnospiraceae bacterium]